MKVRQGVVGFTMVCTVCLLSCAGCGSKNAKKEIALNYAPAGTGLLSDLKSIAISLEVVDQRPEAQQQNIGVQRNTVWGSEHAAVVSKVPEVQVIRDAIQTELEWSGHRVVDPGQQPAPMAVKIGITQFLFDSKATSDLDIELVGIVCADVTASVATAGRRQVSFTIESAYRDVVQMGWLCPLLVGSLGAGGNATRKSNIEKVMNGALAEFVRRLCLEPKLREVFVAAVNGRELSPVAGETYARQPVNTSPSAAAGESITPDPRQGTRDLREVQESGWIESISIAQGQTQNGQTVNVLHGTRDYLLTFRPDCVVDVRDDPLMKEIAVDKLLRFLQGRQHGFTARGYVGADAFTLGGSEKLQVLEVFRLERERNETDARDRSPPVGGGVDDVKRRE
jgi:hypothetical protein